MNQDTTTPGKNRAVITGASYGIGEDFARILAQEKFDLVLVARSGERLAQLARELSQGFSVEVVTIVKDLTKPGAPEEVYIELERQGRQVDVLINNAGFGLHGEFVSLGREEQLEMIQLNILALTNLTRLFLPGMVHRRSGRVLNVASTAAFQPGPLMAVYYATKAYVLSFSEAIHEEVRGTGVTVTCLCPGPTKSEFKKRAGMSEEVPIFKYGTMPSLPVAQAGVNAMLKGRPLVISGAINKIAAFLTRFAPRVLTPRIVRFVQADRARRNEGKDPHRAL